MQVNQLLFIAAATASLGLSLWAFISVLRTPGLPKKFLWAVISLMGVGGIALVWPASDHVFPFLGIAAPVFSFDSGDDWIPEVVRVLFPLGAFAAFWRVRSFASAGENTTADLAP